MKKKKTNIFFKLLSCLFLTYIALLIAFESGYYQTKVGNKAILTKDAMQKFETDVENGEIVDIKDYLKEEKIDYSNTITKIGNKASKTVENIMTKGISNIINALKGLFWN